MLKWINKMNWMVTWLAMAMLKRSLRYRIEGANRQWLQQVPIDDISIFNRVDFLTNECNGKRVLHIGFSDYPYTKQKITDGSLLHIQLQKRTKTILGLDMESAAIAEYIQITRDDNVVYGDITKKYPKEAISFNPEIILLSEVAEHLKAPYQAGDILYESFAHGTKVLVTVPNYTALDSIASSIHKTESIHPHHHWYFSPFTLCKLFDADRFTMEQLHFGMYYLPGAKINALLKRYPFNGDCIMAVFSIKKTKAHA